MYPAVGRHIGVLAMTLTTPKFISSAPLSTSKKILSQVSNPLPHLVIDGQQRLTTVTLLLTALAEALDDGALIDGFSARNKFVTTTC